MFFQILHNCQQDSSAVREAVTKMVVYHGQHGQAGRVMTMNDRTALQSALEHSSVKDKVKILPNTTFIREVTMKAFI